MKLLILFLFLLKSILISNALEFNVVDNYNFTRYPSYTVTNICVFGFYIWVSDPNISSYTFESHPMASHTIAGRNDTHVLLSFNFQLTGAFNNFINATDGLDAGTLFPFYCSCLKLQENEIDFQPVGNIYYDYMGSFSLIVKRIGVPSYSSLGITVNTYGGSEAVLSDGIHSRITIPFYDMPAITSQIKIDFQYDVGLYKSVYVANYFNTSYNSNFQLIYHPNNINNSLLLMGKELLPSFTFSATSQNIEPLYSCFIEYASSPLYRAIYESNGVTTYLSTYYYSSTTLVYDFLFYAQILNQKSLVYNQSVSLIDAPYSVLSTDIGTYLVQNEAVILNINIAAPTNDVYNLNKIRFSTNLIPKYIESPFGFGPSGGNNKNYVFSISIPYFKKINSASYYIFGQQSDISISENTDDPLLYSTPEILNYEFQFITNSKYIFKTTILSSLCGVTGISFDGAEYKRISQFRINGSSTNGYYEIPIDLETSSTFIQVSLLDLCNNIVDFRNGDFLPKGVTFFNIPFLTNWNNVDLTSIENISYLYNNIDTSAGPISNIIYFDYPNYDIKNAPLVLRFPNFEYRSSNVIYTNEYYGKWNSTIGKFQIEFTIPKNSRVGKFAYLISLVGSSSFISSSTLSDDYQLYIVNSNFDGIGPIVTNIKTYGALDIDLPYIGWSLTISDPINGFNFGYITVMGSLDNSIYKFELSQGDIANGTIFEGVYNITVKLVNGLCVNQDYIITKATLYDTAGQKTKFERDLPDYYDQFTPSLNNPFYLISDNPSLLKYTITCDSPADTTPPSLFFSSTALTNLNVGSSDRSITFQINATDIQSGINYYAQGPIVYLIAENFELVECISILVAHTPTTADYSCTLEVPFGFGSEFGKIYVSVYNVINNHGLYKGYTSSMLNLNIPTTFSLTGPVLLEPGIASSKGGEFYFSGRNLDQVSNVYINYTDIKFSSLVVITDFQYYGSTLISISTLKATDSDFYVFVESNQGELSNRLLVSPVVYNDNPFVTIPPTIAPTSSPLPTNAPQQCKGSPVCGGPSNGYCDSNLGCKCYSPWIGNDCLSQVIEVLKPVINQTQPSTTFELNINNNSSTNNNVHFKSLISIYSIREINIDDKILNEYPLYNQTWAIKNNVDNDDNNNIYLLNITNNNNNQITQVSVKLEWFNSSKTISFANQDIEMNANSMKYTIEISNYQFKNKLTRLQLVMSALFSSTSSDSCSFKEFGETSSGDNSNYLKIQIDNKSLYSRLIKRAILDESRITSIENTLLDNTMNPIETSTESQSFIAINIPAFDYKVAIDPDFSVLLDSHSVDKSYSNSKCKNQSKSLTNSQLAGIIVGGFAALVVIIIISLFIISKSFKYKSKSLLKLHLKLRSIYDK